MAKEMDLAAVFALLKRTLAPILGEDEFDVVSDENLSTVEVMTDDWTLQLDCQPNGHAWLALDTEPESAVEARTLREKVMGPEIVRALADVDDELDGALTVKFLAADDCLSTDLVTAMADARAESLGEAPGRSS